MEEEIMTPEAESAGTAELAARLAAAEAENCLYRLAPGLGVSPRAVPYLARLCPDPGGDDEAVTAAVERVLADLPGLREPARSGPPGGFRVGAGLSGTGASDEALLRAAFGIR